MSDPDALVAAALDQIGDNTPWLVLAGRLDDHGHRSASFREVSHTPLGTVIAGSLSS